MIKILSSLVKVILFIYITTVVCQGGWLPWKPCRWYSTRAILFELNQSATEWRCLVWKTIMGELILMNLCRPALGVQFFWDTVYIEAVNNVISTTLDDFMRASSANNRLECIDGHSDWSSVSAYVPVQYEPSVCRTKPSGHWLLGSPTYNHIIQQEIRCGTWYMPHSRVYGHISTSGQKSDATIVFTDPDFL